MREKSDPKRGALEQLPIRYAKKRVRGSRARWCVAAGGAGRHTYLEHLVGRKPGGVFGGVLPPKGHGRLRISLQEAVQARLSLPCRGRLQGDCDVPSSPPADAHAPRNVVPGQECLERGKVGVLVRVAALEVEEGLEGPVHASDRSGREAWAQGCRREQLLALPEEDLRVHRGPGPVGAGEDVRVEPHGEGEVVEHASDLPAEVFQRRAHRRRVLEVDLDPHAAEAPRASPPAWWWWTRG